TSLHEVERRRRWLRRFAVHAALELEANAPAAVRAGLDRSGTPLGHGPPEVVKQLRLGEPLTLLQKREERTQQHPLAFDLTLKTSHGLAERAHVLQCLAADPRV